MYFKITINQFDKTPIDFIKKMAKKKKKKTFSEKSKYQFWLLPTN
jgi:hypothetical protein